MQGGGVVVEWVLGAVVESFWLNLRDSSSEEELFGIIGDTRGFVLIAKLSDIPSLESSLEPDSLLTRQGFVLDDITEVIPTGACPTVEPDGLSFRSMVSGSD